MAREDTSPPESEHQAELHGTGPHCLVLEATLIRSVHDVINIVKMKADQMERALGILRARRAITAALTHPSCPYEYRYVNSESGAATKQWQTDGTADPQWRGSPSVQSWLAENVRKAALKECVALVVLLVPEAVAETTAICLRNQVASSPTNHPHLHKLHKAGLLCVMPVGESQWTPLSASGQAASSVSGTSIYSSVSRKSKMMSDLRRDTINA